MAHYFRSGNQIGKAAKGRWRSMAERIAIVSKGRRAPLQGPSRERPQSVPKRTYASRDSSDATLAVTLPQQEVGQLRVPCCAMSRSTL